MVANSPNFPLAVTTASATVNGAITVTASSTLVPCSGTLTLSSGPATQTVSASTAITNVFYQLSTNCTDTTTVSATGLPPGVTMTWDKAVRPSTISLSGTPSAAASGTYNYSILQY